MMLQQLRPGTQSQTRTTRRVEFSLSVPDSVSVSLWCRRIMWKPFGGAKTVTAVEANKLQVLQDLRRR